MEKKVTPTPESLLAPLQELVDHCVDADRMKKTAGPEMKQVGIQFKVDAECFKQGLLLIRLLPTERRLHDIGTLQQGLTNLMDIIHAQVGSDQLEVEQNLWKVRTRTIGGVLYSGLEGLLFHMEHHCKEEFDYGIPLCDSQRGVWGVKMQWQLGVVHDWFAAEQFPEALCDHVMVPYYEIMQPANLPLLTYREWMYLSSLLSELENVIKKQPADAEEMLLRVLIRYNFNRDEYMDYCIQYFEGELKQDGLTHAERVARTLHYRRLIVSTSPTTDIALLPRHDALHMRLMKWCDGTLDMYERLQEEAGEIVPDRRIIPSKDVPRKQRLPFAESVEKLAALKKVLYRCGLYPGTNESEFTRHVAYGFSTKGTGEPVWKNIKKAFDNPSEAALQYVADVCYRMLREIDAIRRGDKK